MRLMMITIQRDPSDNGNSDILEASINNTRYILRFFVYCQEHRCVRLKRENNN
jgi:hypothetical protein